MDDMIAMIIETAHRAMAAHATHATLLAAEDGVFPAALWNVLSDAGLPHALVPEDAGGAGLPPVAGMAMLRVAGEYALPMPLAETMLAAWLASRAGLGLPDGPLTFAPVRADEGLSLSRGPHGWRLTGEATRLPWGRDAAAALVLAMHEATPHLAWVAQTGWDVQPGTSVAKEPRDTLRFHGPVLEAAPSPVDAVLLRGFGAALRCQQIAGALTRITAMTTQYAQDRVQFGRPIGRFQAVQQNLAVLAGQTAAAIAAADLAAEALTRPPAEALRAIAAAKTRAGEAASIAPGIAHQVHGAIGFTIEHGLHVLTRRLWSWREEFGKEAEWAARLGSYLAAQGAERLWAEITAA